MSEDITTTTEELATTDMTPEEARTALAEIRATMKTQKRQLLEFHERRGYIALNYKTWEGFAEAEFGITVQHYNNLLRAARVEHNLENLFSKQQSIPLTYALELSKLPTAEQQQAAYQEAISVAPQISYRGKDSRFNGHVRLPLIEKIVARMLGNEQKNKLKTAPDYSKGKQGEPNDTAPDQKASLPSQEDEAAEPSASLMLTDGEQAASSSSDMLFDAITEPTEEESEEEASEIPASTFADPKGTFDFEMAINEVETVLSWLRMGKASENYGLKQRVMKSLRGVRNPVENCHI